MNKIIYTKNGTHLGDCLYSMIFFKIIQDYIEQEEILFYFYCLKENLDQIRDFNTSSNVIVEPINNINNDVFVHDLWIGSSQHEFNYYIFLDSVPDLNTNSNSLYYDVFFCKYYNYLLEKLGFQIKIDKFIYNDPELLKRCNDISTKYLELKNIDFLINNSEPRSGQIDYDISEWNSFIIQLSKKYNIITTQKVSDIKCTRDYNLKAMDIAAISINIKNFICIESGIFACLYNTFIVDRKDIVVYNLSKYNYHKCSFSNFIWKSNIKDMFFLISEP